MPVTVPAGWARVSTKPALTGSLPTPMGIVVVAFLAARIHRSPSCYHDDIDLKTHQFGCKLRSPIGFPFRISVFDGDVLFFFIAKLAQSQPNCLGTGRLTSGICCPQIPYSLDFLRLLRLSYHCNSKQYRCK